MVTAVRVEARVVRMAAMVNWVATVAQTEALEAAVVRAARRGRGCRTQLPSSFELGGRSVADAPQ